METVFLNFGVDFSTFSPCFTGNRYWYIGFSQHLYTHSKLALAIPEYICSSRVFLYVFNLLLLSQLLALRYVARQLGNS